ncbi:MAG: LysR substrate-binding domain-containing protein [Collimonas pratensis]|uniref:choline sulfate utilization transcriptional regulator n=1 Tax=Collimonas pratensis TaxID=279113 RepID=UPI003C7741AE
MADLRRLPPLQSLAFFEAAARHLNFTAAAKELGTTQPAVSHRIGLLEEDLGVALFTRGHRGVALNADGTRLFEAVHDSLGTIGNAVAQIRARRTRQVLSVATDFAFASYWLMPQLGALRKLVADLDVRIVTSQKAFDIREEAVDVAIAFGDGRWPGCEAELLFPEIVVPVCSPSFRDRHGLSGDPANLAQLPLLHLESDDPARWLSWESWFARHKLAAGRSHGHDLSFNNYPLLMQAASAGQGLALGWLPLVSALLESGQLVQAVDHPVRTDNGYFLVRPNARRSSAAVELFRQWITGQCV